MGELPREDGSYPVLRMWWGWGSQGELHRRGDLGWVQEGRGIGGVEKGERAS